MTVIEYPKKFIGPSLAELVDKKDLVNIRYMIYSTWLGMICVGFVIGVSCVRIGWV
jgi:hypothetical protein